MSAHLSANEVQGLYAVGAFVDLSDPGIAKKLLYTTLSDEAVTTIYLYAEIGRFRGEVCK